MLNIYKFKIYKFVTIVLFLRIYLKDIIYICKDAYIVYSQNFMVTKTGNSIRMAKYIDTFT